MLNKNKTYFLLLILCFVTPAYGAEPQYNFNSDIFKPSPENIESLNEKVNFGFKSIKLSEMLLLLSKVGEFNVVLPQELDRDISITIRDQKIIDAVKDIAKLVKLDYEFRGRSLIFSDTKNFKTSFSLIPISHRKPDKIVGELNESIFKGLSLIQNPDLPNAEALVSPDQNAVIVYGNSHQIKLATDYIKQVDKTPFISLLNPEHLSFQECKSLLRAFNSSNNEIEITRYKQDTFLIKGQQKTVEDFNEFLKKYDKAPSFPSFDLSIYAFSDDATGILKQSLEVNHDLQLFKLGKQEKLIDASSNKLDSYIKDFLLDSNSTEVLGYKIKFQADILDSDKVRAQAHNQSIVFSLKNEKLAYLITASDLKKNGKLRKRFKIDKDQSLLVVLRAI